jgi:catechol 2,3-dioxygenase-like lactoylglutathione lyase family enzyme
MKTAGITALDHVQIAGPVGCEAEARRFYGEILGLKEIEKPEPLRSRGGCWFQCGAQQVHIGVEEEFRPARKAHPAFRVSDLRRFRERLLEHGVAVRDDDASPGVRRFYADDPWGNRLEFVGVD